MILGVTAGYLWAIILTSVILGMAGGSFVTVKVLRKGAKHKWSRRIVQDTIIGGDLVLGDKHTTGRG